MVLLNVYGAETLNGSKPWETAFRWYGMHPCIVLLRQDASLFGRTCCQRLLFSDGVILIRKNIRAGITFQRWSNPDSEEYSYRDYFMVMESIFIRQNLQLGIIFIGEKHLNLEECSYKDAFVVEK